MQKQRPKLSEPLQTAPCWRGAAAALPRRGAARRTCAGGRWGVLRLHVGGAKSTGSAAGHLAKLSRKARGGKEPRGFTGANATSLLTSLAGPNANGNATEQLRNGAIGCSLHSPVGVAATSSSVLEVSSPLPPLAGRIVPSTAATPSSLSPSAYWNSKTVGNLMRVWRGGSCRAPRQRPPRCLHLRLMGTQKQCRKD